MLVNSSIVSHVCNEDVVSLWDERIGIVSTFYIFQRLYNAHNIHSLITRNITINLLNRNFQSFTI